MKLQKFYKYFAKMSFIEIGTVQERTGFSPFFPDPFL